MFDKEAEETSREKLALKKRVRSVNPGGGGYFLIRGFWGCAAGWSRIFTTGLTIMVLHF